MGEPSAAGPGGTAAAEAVRAPSGEWDAALPPGSPTASDRAARFERIARKLDRDGVALATLLVLALLAFSPWWLGGRIIAPLDVLHEAFSPWNAGDDRLDLHNHFTSDAVTQYIVYRRIAERSFALDGRIGWSDLTGGGRPEYANTMGLYADWTVQLHRFLDFWTAWHVGLLAQLLIAALGMYVLLRSTRLRPLAALVASVGFAAGTPLVFSLYHRWILAAFCWLPWLFWAALRWRGGDRRTWVLVPVFLGLALLGASLQTATFVVLALGALWAGWLWEVGGRRERLRLTAHVVAWGLLGAGLAAFWLLPTTLTYLDGIDLHGGRSTPGYTHGPLQPLLGLLFIPLQLVPTLLGSPASLDLAKLFRADLAVIAFFGLVPTAVALRCTVWRQTPPAARALLLAGLLLPLTPLVGALYHRVQVLFLFGGAWAFGHYWQKATPLPEHRLRLLGFVLGGVAGAWLLASIALWVWEAQLVAAVQAHVDRLADAGAAGRLGGFRSWLLERAAHLVRELRIWHPVQVAAVVGAVLGYAALRLRSRRAPAVASLVLLLAVGLELGSLAVRWHAAVDPARHPPYPVTPDLAALQEAAAGGRVHVATAHDGPAPFLPPNTLAMYDIATIDQFETVDLHGMWQAAGRATDARTLGRLGVSHAVAPAGTAVEPGWRLASAGTTLDIWANNTPVPRYLAVGAGETAEAALDATQRAAAPAPATVQALAGTPGRRLLAVGAGVAAVRVAENWSEGWEYRREAGEWRPVERSADRSMLLRLDDDRRASVVELRFRPRRRSAGWLLSAAAAILTVVAGAAVAGRARNDGTQPQAA